MEELNEHICPVCGKPVEKSKYGYWKTYCCKSCATKAQRANPEYEKKLKETCIRKYGVDNPAKAKSIKDKAKQTCQQKYGGNSPMNSILTKNKFNLQEINTKRTQTKRENKTFNTSITEIQSYNLLKTKYSDVVSQYNSNLYPYNCDFYIPCLDLYIECNYHWTHGGHPYNNETDIDKLAKWQEKSKTSKFYINAIDTWTIRDVKKRQVAKQNNLNYLEFYNVQELQKWLDQN